MRTMIQELQHVTNVLCILDHKVQLHVKLSANQLKILKVSKVMVWLIDER